MDVTLVIVLALGAIWMAYAVKMSRRIYSHTDLMMKQTDELVIVPASGAAPEVVIHLVNGWNVTGEYNADGEANLVSIRIEAPKPCATSFTISRETAASRFKKNLGMDDIAVGDDRFDDECLCKSNNTLFLLSRLGSALRSRLLAFADRADEFTITHAGFTARFSAVTGERPAFIDRTAEEMIAIHRAITGSPATKPRLKSIIFDDPIAHVRLRCLEAYAAQFGLDASFERCLADADIGVQIAAARHLGEKGLSHLATLIGSQPDIADEDKTEIIRFCNERTHPLPGTILATLLDGAHHRDLLSEAIGACRFSSDPSLSEHLLRRLERAGLDDLLRLEIILVLGDCGTLAAVEPLYRIAENRRLSSGPRTAANEAIARIQSRQGTGERGWLSVSTPAGKEGALSITRGAGQGALSSPNAAPTVKSTARLKTGNRRSSKKTSKKKK
ncbi:MAG TPA: hypothetical protein PLE73_01660 [Spirochaetota bacterium]|nr:hypothetical protein [Spirochaetota bacterium]HPI21870.1 hypothetical protein [Spirochaetota bacterium]HPU87679.1 hypothetical protein [Spirochaetota bacterium]